MRKFYKLSKKPKDRKQRQEWADNMKAMQDSAASLRESMKKFTETNFNFSPGVTDESSN